MSKQNKGINPININSGTGVSFEDNNYRRDVNLDSQLPTSEGASFIIKHSHGLVKNEKQANIVLIIFAVVVIIFSLYLSFGLSNNSKKPTPEDKAAIEKMGQNSDYNINRQQ